MSHSTAQFIAEALQQKDDPDIKRHLLTCVMEDRMFAAAPALKLAESILQTAVSPGEPDRVRTHAFNAYKEVPNHQPQLVTAEHVEKINKVALNGSEDVNVRFVALRALNAVIINRPDLVTPALTAATQKIAEAESEAPSLKQLASLNMAAITPPRHGSGNGGGIPRPRDTLSPA